MRILVDVPSDQVCIYIHYVDGQPIYVGMGDAARAFIYNGLREAARMTGAHPSTISQCINGKKKHAAGLRFIRLEKENV